MMHRVWRKWRGFVAWASFAALVATVALLAADPRSRVLASNTILLSCAVASASVLLAAPLAFLLVRTDVVGRKMAGVLLLALLFMPLYVQAAAWQAGFGVTGWYASAAGGPALLEGWRGAIAIHVLAAIPWVVAIVGIGLRLAEPELEEEALLDGTPGQVFRRVTIRRAANALAAAFLWVAIATAGEMTIADLFRIRTFSEQVYTEFALGDGAAPWKIVPSAIATLWIVVAGLILSNRLIPPDRFTSQRQSPVFRLGRWRALASLIMLGVVGLLLGIPIGSLMWKAGTTVTREAHGFVRSWSLDRCFQMVFGSPVRFSHEFGWSLAIASLAATAAVIIGLPLAWSARRGGYRAAPAWLTIGFLLALPGPLIGLGLVACFNVPDWPWLLRLYDHSIAAVWIAQTLHALPLCTLVLWYALRTVATDLLHSATLEGTGALRRFFRIALPQRWSAVAAAWLIALAMAWGELSASILVVPPGVTILPVRIFGLIHYGVDDQVAGVSLAITAGFFGIALVMAAVTRLASRRR
ncbi:MAG: iron ABC transporter permease [Planctomycetia bacterium]|nr:iron ABC transporter permease [Planctomycetia bacterium]